MSKYELVKKGLGKRLTAIGLVLTLGVPLVGCAEKAECEIPESHVHLYTKDADKDIRLQTFFLGEYTNWDGYQRQDEYIKITKDDERAYDRLNGKFLGTDNWDYLYFQMAHHHDYLRFYYEYWTTEIETYTDSDGNTQTRIKNVHHDGWTDNPYKSDNTGKVRLYHHKYYGYRLVCEEGKYRIEKSPLVDDIREIIDEYPYFDEDCVTTVYETFKFKKRELGNLTIYDDFNPFKQPDLANKELYPVSGRSR